MNATVLSHFDDSFRWVDLTDGGDGDESRRRPRLPSGDFPTSPMTGGGFTPQRKAMDSARKVDNSPDKVLTPHADLERLLFSCFFSFKIVCSVF